MIEKMTGICSDIHDRTIVIDVNGVGYAAEVPERVAKLCVDGQEIRLWIHTHVREDALRLFGFAAREERDLFRVVLGLSGVGPKVALAILSSFEPAEFVDLVQRDEAKKLEVVPGIGARQSKKIILEAKPKIERWANKFSGMSPAKKLSGAGRDVDMNSDLVAALEGLGYKTREINTVLNRIGEDLLEVEFKEALRLTLTELNTVNSAKIKRTHADPNELY